MTRPAPQMFRFIYPSKARGRGEAMRSCGVFEVYQRENGQILLVLMPDVATIKECEQDPNCPVIILDQRAIVLNETTGQVVYYPHQPGIFARLDPASQEWLTQHQHWGKPGCDTNWEHAIMVCTDTPCTHLASRAGIGQDQLEQMWERSP